MAIFNSEENITVVLTTGQTAVFADAEYDYRYYRIVVSGNQGAAASEIRINGVTAKYGGIVAAPDSFILDAPIWDCKVIAGQAILFGTKSTRFIFGKFGSSSEGLT